MAVSKTIGYQHTRARIQRLADSRFFAGWVDAIDESSARLVGNQVSGLCPGDSVVVQCFGDRESLIFPALVQSTSESAVELTVKPPIRRVRTEGQKRIQVDNWRAHVVLPESDFEVFVVDVSPSGMGFLSPLPISGGEEIRVSVQLETGTVSMTGPVRYCKRVGVEPDVFRVGFQIDSMNRIDRGRWQASLEKLSDA